MNYAVLFDLNSTRADCEAFRKAVSGLDGSISYCKFYSYNAKRNTDYSAYIRENGADIAVPLYNRKKVRIDMRQVIDAVTIACTNKSIDAFFIVCAPIDCMPMLNSLKSMGKYVVLGGESKPAFSRGYDEFVELEKGVGLEKHTSAKVARMAVRDGFMSGNTGNAARESGADVRDQDMEDTSAKESADKYAGKEEGYAKPDGRGGRFVSYTRGQDGKIAEKGGQNETEKEDFPLYRLNSEGRPEEVSDEELLAPLKTDNPSFLPFTDIRDNGDERMREVRKRLDGLINDKLSKPQPVKKTMPTGEDLDMLLKKYF